MIVKTCCVGLGSSYALACDRCPWTALCASGLLSFALALTLALAFVSAGCPRSPRRLGTLRRLAGSVRNKAGLPTLDRRSGARSATIFVIGSHGLGLRLGHS